MSPPPIEGPTNAQLTLATSRKIQKNIVGLPTLLLRSGRHGCSCAGAKPHSPPNWAGLGRAIINLPSATSGVRRKKAASRVIFGPAGKIPPQAASFRLIDGQRVSLLLTTVYGRIVAYGGVSPPFIGMRFAREWQQDSTEGGSKKFSFGRSNSSKALARTRYSQRAQGKKAPGGATATLPLQSSDRTLPFGQRPSSVERSIRGFLPASEFASLSSKPPDIWRR